MVLAMALLLFQFPATAPTASQNRTEAASEPSRAASQIKQAAAVPAAHAETPQRALDGLPESADNASNEAFADSSLSGIYLPLPPAFRPKVEPVQRTSRLWLGLSAVQHGSAAFDAWSTRRAISQGRMEADPAMHPFANSTAIYGAIQVIPFGLDYVGRRMQRSTGWTHRVWWVPQSLATAAYLFSGSYNVAHTH